jgi:predicted ATPase/DNA-binding SARP family transcriptional activator
MVTTIDDVTVDLLGPLRVTKSGETVSFPAPMQRALVAFLALDPGRAAPLPAIVEALWDRPPGQAVNMVQQLVSAVRRRLSSEVVVTRGRAYQLQVVPPAVDYVRFTELIRTAAENNRTGRSDRAARGLETALGLWRGTALVDLPESPFVNPARVAMHQERDEAHLVYLAVLLTEGRSAQAIPALERIVHDRPLDERAAELLIRALGQAGRQADALSVYEATRNRLVDELGLDPGPGMVAAQQGVLRHELAAPASLPTVLPQRRLPRPRTSLIGRENDLDRLAQLFAGGAPLVTVTGPGGVGKTRVALAHAIQSIDLGTVFFVDLTPLSEAQQVLAEVAAAVGVREYDRDTLPDQIGRILARASALLVLDNFEHLLDAANDLARLLSALESDTRVLVTSRAPLRITGEHLLVLDPLSATDLARADGESVSTAPAVALYRERTAAAHPGVLKHTSDAVIAALCQRLDGLPLAIELAAARADLAPPELLLSDMNTRLALLGAGPRDAPHRHRTLRACIDWSVDQLTDDVRVLFAVLAVFAGGASVASIRDVCGAVAPGLDVATALDELAAHNLIRVDPTEHGPRIVMLDTIHDRARDELETKDLSRSAQTAHSQQYLTMCASGPAYFLWPPTTAAQMRLWSTELPNARAALETLHARGEFRDLARLALALWPLWLVRGEVEEAADWLRRVAWKADVPEADRTQILLRLVAHAAASHGVEKSLSMLREATACGGRLSDPSVQVRLALAEESAAYSTGDEAGAERAHHRAREVAELSGDEDLVAETAYRAALTDADTLLNSANDRLRYAKKTHNEVLEMVIEANYSSDAAATEDPRLWRMGEQWGTHGAALAAALGDREAVAVASANAAICSLLAGGNPDRTLRQLKRSLDILERLGHPALAIECLLRISAGLSAAGAYREAAGLAAAAKRLTAERGAAMDAANAPLQARFLDPLPELLGADVYRNAVAAWETLTWEEVARKALLLPQLAGLRADKP